MSTPPTGPTLVRGIVSQTIARLAERQRQSALVDYPVWKTLVGARTARHAQPVWLRQGRLTIRVRDSAWLYELSLRSPELLAGLRQALPDREVREVAFSLGEIQW